MEYVGYVPGNIIDWSAIGKSLNENYNRVQEAWQARDVEAEEMRLAGQKAIDDTEKMSVKTTQEFMGDTANTLRDHLYQLKKDRDTGKIKHSEYKIQYNNLMSSYGNLVGGIKGMDQFLVEFNKRQQPDENNVIQGSSFEAAMVNRAMSLKDLSDKQVTVGQDGRVIVSSRTNPDEIIDMATFSTIENLFDNRLNLTPAVQDKVKPLGDYITQQVKAGGKEVSLKSIIENPNFAKAEVDMIYSIANPNNPRSILSVLADNSDGQFKIWSSIAERDNIVAEAISKQELVGGPMSDDQRKAFGEKYIKENLIQLAPDPSGVLQPIINDSHVKAAHEIVKNQIRVQLDRVYEESRGFAPQSPSGSGNTVDKELAEGYKLTVNAMTVSPIGSDSYSDDYLAQLSSRSNKYFKRVKFKDGSFGIEAYDLIEDPNSIDKKMKPNESTRTEIRTAKALAQYVFKGDLSKANTQWETGKNKAEELGIEPAKPKKKFN